MLFRSDSQPAAPRPDQFVAEMELLPGSKFAKDGDHLALIYALPQCAECEDTTIALRLRSPGQRPNATWRVVGLDDASRPERTTMIAVDDDPSAPGTYVARIPTHQPSARGEATAVHALFIRADFPANTFPQAQDSAANRGEHEVVVHQDGTLSVVSSVNLAKPALNGELRPTIEIGRAHV